MADDVDAIAAAIDDDIVNPCCNQWKIKCTKLEQKIANAENSRNILRQCVKLLHEQVPKLQAENTNLTKELKDERLRLENERKEKEKESAAKVSLENEILSLKSEMLSLNNGGSQEEQVKLQARVCDGEAEMSRLREQLQKERSRADSARKKAEEEKKKADEACRSAKTEKIKADKELALLRDNGCKGEKEINTLRGILQKERARADLNEKRVIEALESAKTEKSKAEALQADRDRVRASLEGEISSLKTRLMLLQQKGVSEVESTYQHRVSEGEVEIKRLKELLEKEKMKTHSEKKKAEVERKKAQKAGETAKAEKARADEECKVADIERKKAIDIGLLLEKLQAEVKDTRSKLVLERSKFEDANRKLEVERQKAIEYRNSVQELVKLAEKKKKRESSKEIANKLMPEEACRRLGQVQLKGKQEPRVASLELEKVSEHRMVEEVYRKRLEIKDRAAESQMLQDWGRIDEVRKEKLEHACPGSLVRPSAIPQLQTVIAESDKLKLLQKELKLVKMQVKHGKQVAKLEKSRTNILEQELCRLKVEFAQLSHRLEHGNCFAEHDVGKSLLAKCGNIISRQKTNPSEACPLHLQGEDELLRPASDHFLQHIELSPSTLPISGNLTESTSGIASKLEPLLRGSNRKLLHSSAIDSSMASFSDRPLVGSQEKGGFSITKSAELSEEKSNDHLPISRLSREVNETRYDKNTAVVGENVVRGPGRGGNRSKRKRILDSVESIENLYAEGKRWHLKMADNLSTLNDCLESQMDKLSDDGLLLIPDRRDNRYHEQENCHKKTKLLREHEMFAQDLQYSNEQKDDPKADCIGKDYVAGYVSEVTDMSINEMGICGWDNLVGFERLVDGNYMKLLEFDDSADEVKYRMAIEMPLSPTLPEIECKSMESLEIDDSTPCSAGDPILGNMGYKALSESSVGCASYALPRYCVVFSDMYDGSSLSKIFNTTRKVCQFSFSKADRVVENALSTLSEVENLLPREKVCVFFSNIIGSFSGVSLKNSSLPFDSEFTCLLDMIGGQLMKAISVLETRNLFTELCDLDELLALVEDFLVAGRVLVHGVECIEPSLVSGREVSNINNSNLTFEDASFHQLVCGAAALASFCAAFDNTGFLCEASYNIARMKKFCPLTLTFIHVFAYVCGPQFFALSNYSLIMTVVSSLVMFHETENVSTDSAPGLQTGTATSPSFPLCSHCPFSKGAVSMEALTSLLLDKLLSSAQALKESVSCLNFNAPLQTKEPETNCNHTGERFATIGDGTLLILGDVLSLLELVASNMSWNWTCDNIVSQLLKMLELCFSDNLVAAIFVLLGQLARLGIVNKGHEDAAVENIRGRLCSFLSQRKSQKTSLAVQVATVSALLGMISISFKEIVTTNAELSTVAILPSPADCIRTWYLLLSPEEKCLTTKLLTSG